MNLASKQTIDNIIGKPIAYFFIFFAKVFGFLLRRNHDIKKEPNAILVIKILGLGSMFIASDSLLCLKKKYPNAKMILVCKDSLKPGIEPLNLFDEIWEVDDSNIFQLIKQSFLILFKTWRIKKLWVLDLEVYSKLTTVFTLLTCAVNRFGFYLNEVSFRDELNTHHTYFNQFTVVEENYKRIVSQMGAEPTSSFSFDDFPKREKGKNYSFIAINNTCSELSIERKIPNDILAQIVKKILDETSYQIAFLGAPSDYMEVSNFINKYIDLVYHDRIVNTINKFSFKEYYDFLYFKCKILLTIDSAPLHIANKINVPTLSIWGPTKPETLIKVNESNQAIYLSIGCSPCVHLTDKLPCNGDNICMKNISSASIYSELIKSI